MIYFLKKMGAYHIKRNDKFLGNNMSDVMLNTNQISKIPDSVITRLVRESLAEDIATVEILHTAS